MFSRKNTDEKGLPVPQNWQEQVVALLNNNYESQCLAQNKSFDVYGEIFANEILVIVSWLDDKDSMATPASCFLSADIDKKTKSEVVLDHLVDLAGVFFDEYFNDPDWSEWEPNWQTVKHKKETYFYKITRENVALTIKASQLLDDDVKKNQ